MGTSNLTRIRCSKLGCGLPKMYPHNHPPFCHRSLIILEPSLRLLIMITRLHLSLDKTVSRHKSSDSNRSKYLQAPGGTEEILENNLRNVMLNTEQRLEDASGHSLTPASAMRSESKTGFIGLDT